MSSVDVIVPCYRYGHFLRQCVESILTQSLKNVRVLIIDDASPDETAGVAAELVKQDCRVTSLRHGTNQGHIYTYNEGIEWASSDYMLVLSADDYLLPGSLSRAVKLLDSHSHVGFVFGNVIELKSADTSGQLQDMVDEGVASIERILQGLEFIEMSGADNIVKTPTAIVRTELQKRLGGYRPELPHSGDMEMWLRLAAHGQVGIVEAYQAVYRRHSANMSNDYCPQYGLPDLQQRKSAFDCFFRTCGDVVPNAQRLHRKLMWALGSNAVGAASRAFNDGELGVSALLRVFAVGVCPEIKRSWRWTKLAMKRCLGPSLVMAYHKNGRRTES